MNGSYSKMLSFVNSSWIRYSLKMFYLVFLILPFLIGNVLMAVMNEVEK